MEAIVKIDEGVVAVILIQEKETVALGEALELLALARLKSLEHCIETIRLSEMPEAPRPTNCIVRNLCTRKAPIGRGRGPPVPWVSRNELEHSQGPGPLLNPPRLFTLKTEFLMSTKRSRVTLANCQIKSAEKFKEVCKALDVLEKETFIRSGLISFEGMFICPDIDLVEFYNSKDATEHLIAAMCISLHVKQYGKNSRKAYLEIEKHERKKLSWASAIQKKAAKSSN